MMQSEHRGMGRWVIIGFLIRRVAHAIAALAVYTVPRRVLRDAALDPKRQSQAVSSVIMNSFMPRGIRVLNGCRTGLRTCNNQKLLIWCRVWSWLEEA
ncbi:hypothetical protein B0T13DRAFT_210725 [Neurospora crassa]|nr:hypothetical protein B0T13DRAFT_210725 [Neurospora crassa]